MAVKQSQQKRRQMEREDERRDPEELRPLNPKQRIYLDALRHLDTVVGYGPAGTGKTYLACAYAARQLFYRQTSRVILTRPMVGVDGRTMGFLPGNIQKKMEPWARPLVEAFKRHMTVKRYEDAVNAKDLEIVALEHIRGLTFDDAILIIDEAQNTTPKEMKAFLTRIGRDTRVVICGDVSQSDLATEENGLAWVVAACDRGLVPDVGVIPFTHGDTVRSKRCADWARAFDILEEDRANG